MRCEAHTTSNGWIAHSSGQAAHLERFANSHVAALNAGAGQQRDNVVQGHLAHAAHPAPTQNASTIVE